KQAVLSTEGPLLVLAGAGAGKTKVIVHRMLEIVKRGASPEQILAITFTNKSAGEMRERAIGLLEKHLGETLPRSGRPFVSTFHSLGLNIIKENSKLLGFKRMPAIYDRSDSTKAVKEALKSLSIEELEPRAVLSFISRQKGEGRMVNEMQEGGENSRERMLVSAWRLYEQTLASDGALDFDDLLSRSVRFLEQHEAARVMYQKRWPYIHVDEYQDTNRIQAQMMDLLAGPSLNICAVGDVDQTIYGWRGAEIKNILSFEKKFVGAKVVLLEENYRSTKNIIAAANEIIAKNIYRPEKNLFTNNVDGEKISVYQAFDEGDEAGFIVRRIKELMKDGATPRDFAVLYRVNFQSRAIEEAFLKGGVAYQVLGTKFFERREVRDAISFVRAAVYETNADIARIANVPTRGIGKVTLLKMLAGQEDSLGGAVREKVLQFRALLVRIREAAKELPPSKLVAFAIQESGMERAFKEDKLEGAERLENVKELVSLAARFDDLPNPEGLEGFLESAALASDQDELKEDANAVRLMTVHASKGLEFPHVFITGLEEGLFPYEREGGDEGDKEEERRLCYVAITRARRKVFLTHASFRTVFGSKNATFPSQFLSDISPELLENESPERIVRTIYLD
ncbi:MAG: UvrD-helicase domain-containing protein, partial [Patescibacteria group bacterium]